MKSLIFALCLLLPTISYAGDRRVSISRISDWALGINVIIEDTNKGKYVECVFYDENKRTLGKLKRFSDRFSTEADVVTDGLYKAADVKSYICVEVPPCEGCWVPD